MYTGPHLPQSENICLSITPARFNNTTSSSWYKNGILVSATNYQTWDVSGLNLPIGFYSNVSNDGSGTSILRIGNGSTKLQTGSITVNMWFDLADFDINVGGNNNWRALLWCNGGTAGYPVTMVLEQSRGINFSTGHTDRYRRYLNGSFTPITADQQDFQMITYTYDKLTGTAACYKDGSLVRSGAMTTDTSGNNATSAGTALSYSNYTTAGFGHGGTNTGSNPSGEGLIPGYWGVSQFWNVALTSDEVAEVYNKTKIAYEFSS